MPSLYDHEALKSLLDAPHPSGKFGWLGLALQEVDLVINYCPGKGNSKPIQRGTMEWPVSFICYFGSHPANSTIRGWDQVPGMPTVDPTLQKSQRADPELKPIFNYLEKGVLPIDEKLAKEMVLGKSQLVITDGVLYHVEDKSLWIIPPVEARQKLFKEVHEGVYGLILEMLRCMGS